jgi:hypothetical protein
VIFDKALATVAAVLFATMTAVAQTNYPLVLSSESKLKQLGIWFDELSPLPNRCYHYGDGGAWISISHALLAFYQSQGFSRPSACMALISGILFNPETGQRLATYIWTDPKLFKNGRPDPRYWSKGQPAQDGDISDELPISLPRCFARGLPFSDCVWRYDVLTGKRISANDTARHAEVGRRAEQFLSGARARQLFNKAPSDQGGGGFIQPSGFSRHWYEEARDVDDERRSIWRGIHFDYTGGEMDLAMFYDFSNEFPKGYGYALLYVNDGDAGPAASPDTVKAAIEGQRRPQQINLDRLREIWGAGSN